MSPLYDTGATDAGSAVTLGIDATISVFFTSDLIAVSGLALDFAAVRGSDLSSSFDAGRLRMT